METPNLNYIKELSGDDAEFMGSFIKILKDEFPLEKEEYVENINNNNTAAAALNVHKLKHKMNILGLEQGYKTAVSYEEELRDGKSSLKNDFMQIMNTIQAYLKSI